MSQKSINNPIEDAGRESNTIGETSLTGYPAIDSIIAVGSEEELTAMRNSFTSKIADLDLVIRKGSPKEAAEAEKVRNAVEIALDLLRTADQNKTR